MKTTHKCEGNVRWRNLDHVIGNYLGIGHLMIFRGAVDQRITVIIQPNLFDNVEPVVNVVATQADKPSPWLDRFLGVFCAHPPKTFVARIPTCFR